VGLAHSAISPAIARPSSLIAIENIPILLLLKISALL
jgi:hypothetical protein